MKRLLIFLPALLAILIPGLYFAYNAIHEKAIRQGVEMGRRLEAIYTVKSVKAFNWGCAHNHITFCTKEKNAECETIYVACKEAYEP